MQIPCEVSRGVCWLVEHRSGRSTKLTLVGRTATMRGAGATLAREERARTNENRCKRRDGAWEGQRAGAMHEPTGGGRVGSGGNPLAPVAACGDVVDRTRVLHSDPSGHDQSIPRCTGPSPRTATPLGATRAGSPRNGNSCDALSNDSRFARCPSVYKNACLRTDPRPTRAAAESLCASVPAVLNHDGFDVPTARKLST